LDAKRRKRLKGGRSIGLLCRRGHAESSAIVSSQATRNAAASACENGSGGGNFSTVAKGAALLVRKPLSFNRLITRLARSGLGALPTGLTSSTPMNRPWPRTSPIAALA